MKRNFLLLFVGIVEQSRLAAQTGGLGHLPADPGQQNLQDKSMLRIFPRHIYLFVSYSIVILIVRKIPANDYGIAPIKKSPRRDAEGFG